MLFQITVQVGVSCSDSFVCNFDLGVEGLLGFELELYVGDAGDDPWVDFGSYFFVCVSPEKDRFHIENVSFVDLKRKYPRVFLLLLNHVDFQFRADRLFDGEGDNGFEHLFYLKAPLHWLFQLRYI